MAEVFATKDLLIPWFSAQYKPFNKRTLPF